ncbi:hypothetical protein TGAM01_v208413 [Trichoderma gamsii]|uniref:Uncharacterized protein n=1 Tax=Trichoderma gamsii TaxID=398673 RepID=A0A2P4ZEL7_9HYPO|nr:hypothetical protein TGAM01_v208413 [Trichoderma gamsii]PON22727.1 hypothetical protein TGAM01_v208413 [Trichoderma gamsii]
MWQSNRKRTNLLVVCSHSHSPPSCPLFSVLQFSSSSRVYLDFAVTGYICSRKPAFRDRTRFVLPLILSSPLLSSPLLLFSLLYSLLINCSSCVTHLFQPHK